MMSRITEVVAMDEYVDHLHEHFLDPVEMANGRYAPPRSPGYSIEMKPESLEAYPFPDGAAWSKAGTQGAGEPSETRRRTW